MIRTWAHVVRARGSVARRVYDRSMDIRHVVMVLALGASVGCGSHGSAVAPPVEPAGEVVAPAHDDGRYHYDPGRGACVDAGGAAGFNSAAARALRTQT